MSSVTKCDICGEKFTDRDNYINGTLKICYNEYLYDDGTERRKENYDLCEDCAYGVLRVIDKLKELKEKK